MAFKLPNPSPFRQEADKPKNSFADNSFFTDNMRGGFGAGEYGTFSNPSFDPQMYASEGMGEGISSAGDAIADAIANRKKMMTTSRDKPDFSNKIKTPKQRTLEKGASPDLDSKIQTAKSKGNLKRAARLEGRQERRIERQTEGAERIEARQAKKTAKVKARQENKTKKSLDTSVDGSGTQTKDGSPNKFMGGIAAAAGQIGAGNSSIMDGFLENNTAYQMAMKRKQARQAPSTAPTTQAQQAALASLPGGAAADMSGDPVLQAAGITSGGAMDQANPFEGKTFQITPANMMGNAKPTFSAPVQASAEAIYGSPTQRQMSMPKFGSVTQMSPLNSYENPQTVIDRSHGYVASKAAEAFGKIGEELIKKKKGENEDENEQ